MPVSRHVIHILHPRSLIRVGYAITRARGCPASVRFRCGGAAIERRDERRKIYTGRGTRATRRNGGAGQRDVSEQSERWRLIDWFVGGRIISRTRTAPTHCARLITIVTSLTYVCVYVCIYHGQYERLGRGRKLVMLAMSTALTKARRVVGFVYGTVGRLRGGGGARSYRREERVAP